METSTGRRAQSVWWRPNPSAESSRAWQGVTLRRCLFLKCSRLHGSIKTIYHPPLPSSSALAKKLRAKYKHTLELIITSVYASHTKWEKQGARLSMVSTALFKELSIFIFERQGEYNATSSREGGGMPKGCGRESKGAHLNRVPHTCHWQDMRSYVWVECMCVCNRRHAHGDLYEPYINTRVLQWSLPPLGEFKVRHFLRWRSDEADAGGSICS